MGESALVHVERKSIYEKSNPAVDQNPKLMVHQ